MNEIEKFLISIIEYLNTGDVDEEELAEMLYDDGIELKTIKKYCKNTTFGKNLIANYLEKKEGEGD